MTPQSTRGVFGGNPHGHPDFKREKQEQSHFFFDVIFEVYTQVNNRERAKESD